MKELQRDLVKARVKRFNELLTILDRPHTKDEQIEFDLLVELLGPYTLRLRVGDWLRKEAGAINR